MKFFSLLKIILPLILLFNASAHAAVDHAKPAAQKPAAKELDLDVVADLEAWRERIEQSLRRDNGWLTLAGRFIMKEGVNTFGTGADNDIVFPAELKGVGPARLGTITVDGKNKFVSLKIADCSTWSADKKTFTGERALGTSSDKRDWVTLENIAMHVVERDGKYVLRLADNKSTGRAGRGYIWRRRESARRAHTRCGL